MDRARGLREKADSRLAKFLTAPKIPSEAQHRRPHSGPLFLSGSARGFPFDVFVDPVQVRELLVVLVLRQDVAVTRVGPDEKAALAFQDRGFWLSLRRLSWAAAPEATVRASRTKEIPERFFMFV